MSNNISKKLKIKTELLRNLATATEMLKQKKPSSRAMVWTVNKQLEALDNEEEPNPALGRILARFYNK